MNRFIKSLSRSKVEFEAEFFNEGDLLKIEQMLWFRWVAMALWERCPLFTIVKFQLWALIAEDWVFGKHPN